MPCSAAASRAATQLPKENPASQTRAQELERGARVVQLARAAIVRARALPHAAEIETQHVAAELVQRGRRAMHDLVVERAAVERMRMTDHGDERGTFRLVRREQRFERTGGAGHDERHQPRSGPRHPRALNPRA